MEPRAGMERRAERGAAALVGMPDHPGFNMKLGERNGRVQAME